MHPDPAEHLGLVGYWAQKFARRAQDFDDVFSMGTIGLVRACAHYDPERGAAFSTYASVLIRQSIIRHLKVEQQ